MFTSYIRFLSSTFKNYSLWFKNVNDPRAKDKIIYPIKALVWYGILTFIFKLEANWTLHNRFKNKISLNNFLFLISCPRLSKMPHYDTVKNFLKRVNPIDLEKVCVKLIKTLIRKKTFDKYRLGGEYLLIALDGTRQITFTQQHCLKCLETKHSDDTITYHHDILAAKLILTTGLSLHVASEFIENTPYYFTNPSQKYDKQDCEIKAAYKLLDKLHAYYPQLRICILVDSLYLNRKIIKKCKDYNWKYIINFKEGKAKALYRDYEDFKKINAIEKKYEEIKERKKIIIRQYYWKNNLDFQKHKVNVIECLETKNNIATRFVFITNIIVSFENIKELINDGGRKRWKIEHGFNDEKNSGYNLSHLYCKAEKAMKNYYYLLGIAHCLNKLYEQGILTKDELYELKTIKNVTKVLSEHFKYFEVDASLILEKIYLKFDSS